MKIRDWHNYQHFNNRRPPWIKLYREHFLDQRDITMISDCAHRVLIGLLLLASEDKDMQGTLPDVPDIAFRLRMEESKIIKALAELGPWVEQDDIEVISKRYQHDAPERERETETDKSTRTRFAPPTIDEVRSYCQERRNGVDPHKWHDFYCAKGWMVGRNKMKDWRAAVRTWEEKNPKPNGSDYGKGAI